MKINIGPYKEWIGPHQIAEKILFWKEAGYSEDNAVYKLGNWLSEDKYGNSRWLTKVCNWIHAKRKRKVKIKLHGYDTYNLDYTLSLIILPLLKQLKQTQHGAPLVADRDVPKNLRSTSAPPKKKEHDVDANYFKRWEWVLDEMIFAFESKAADDEAQFKIIESGKKTKSGRLSKETLRQLQEHTNRVSNGFRLFGVYYQGLWD